MILLHPDDVERLGLIEDQRITIRSETGSLPDVHIRPFDRIRAGNALMYYPEANALVPRHVDERSRTPAFKNVLIEIEPQDSGHPVAAA